MVLCLQKDEPKLDLDRLCRRSRKAGRRLWNAIPAAYRSGHCFTDFWAAYQAVIPEEQHTAGGSESGHTTHVERWNTTLRQRLPRFVRKTLSFSRVSCVA